MFSIKAAEWLLPSKHKQQDLITPLLPPASKGKPGLESGGSTTQNILLQIKLMVSTAEIASQMSYSECPQQEDRVGRLKPKIIKV